MLFAEFVWSVSGFERSSTEKCVWSKWEAFCI